jgi:hypothetical protein
LLGRAEPILITEGRAVADYREAFVRIDVAELRNAIAIADSGREGEVRFFGEVDASDESWEWKRWCRLVRQLGGLAKVDRVRFYAASFSVICAIA